MQSVYCGNNTAFTKMTKDVEYINSIAIFERFLSTGGQNLEQKSVFIQILTQSLEDFHFVTIFILKNFQIKSVRCIEECIASNPLL